MVIKVKGYLTYSQVIGQMEVEVAGGGVHGGEGPSLLSFVELLATRVGGEHGQALFDEKEGTVGRHIAIMVNGVHYNHLPDRLDTALKDQDEIAVFPPAAGG